MFAKHQFFFAVLTLVALVEVGLCQDLPTEVEPIATCSTRSECSACGKCPLGEKCLSCNSTCAGALNPKSCPANCPKWQCRKECPPGQYFDEISRECLTYEKCKDPICAKCKSMGLQCGPINTCNGTCEGSQNPFTCDETIIFDCHCPSGQLFVSSNPENSNCTAECPGCEKGTPCADCKEKCPSLNCEYGCGVTSCTETCAYILNTTPDCKETCRCRCPPGLFLNADGKCVERDVCICDTCNQNGMKCIPYNCSQTCDGVYNPESCQRIDPLKYQCQCEDGQYFDEAAGSCSEAGECPICQKCWESGWDCGYINICDKTCSGSLECYQGPAYRFGCKCPDGYLNAPGDFMTCIREQQCPEECEKCKEIGECIPYNCNQTCKGLLNPRSCYQMQELSNYQFQCKCPEGQYFDEETFTCVKTCRNCQNCWECEEIDICNPDQVCLVHPKCDREPIYINGCKCPEGELLAPDYKTCIPKDNCNGCLTIKCNNITTCAVNNCDRTCDDVLFGCKETSVTFGCHCKEVGTYYDPISNNCLTKDECDYCHELNQYCEKNGTICAPYDCKKTCDFFTTGKCEYRTGLSCQCPQGLYYQNGSPPSCVRYCDRAQNP